MGFLDNLLAPFGTGAQQSAAAAQQAAIQQGMAQGSAALNQGTQDIQNTYASGLQPLQQTYGTAQQGTQQLGNLLGLGGAGGNASALAALQNTPGYQFTLGQGTQNVDRNAAATGSLNSGNTDKAVADYTTGLANNTYQNAVNNLQPLQQTYGTAQQGTGALASLLGFGGDPSAVLKSLQNTPGYQFTLGQGTSNVDRNAAATGSLNSGNTDTALANYTTGLANNTYQNAVNNLQPYLGLQGQTAGNIGSLSGQEAGQLAGNQQQLASLLYGGNVGQGNAQAQADLAPLQAGANMWGLGGNLAKLALGYPSGNSNSNSGSNFSNSPVQNLASGVFGGISNNYSPTAFLSQG